MTAVSLESRFVRFSLHIDWPLLLWLLGLSWGSGQARSGCPLVHFGIRGLFAVGASPGDPALCSACRSLLERLREDRGWDGHHNGCYVPHRESQIAQTA